MAADEQTHRWRFQRSGGFDQVLLDRGEDLLALKHLDQKLWVALACPIDGLDIDRKTLELIDTDKDGRIRAPELLAAIAWAGSVLVDPASLLAGSARLPLAAINDSEEGKRLAASARQILKDLGKKKADTITLDDTADTARIFAETKLNGDGIVPPESADDEDLKKAIVEIIGAVGPEKDRSGKDGVSQEKLDAFFTEADAFSAWWRAAEADAASVLPLGEETPSAAENLRAVKAKIDDYFTRTRLAAFDERAAAPLNRDPAEYAALSPRLLNEKLAEVAAFPIARVEANRPLPLAEGLNPAWADAVGKLRADVVAPLLGERTSLTEAQWNKLVSRLAAFEEWRAVRAGAKVEPLGLARVRALIDGGYRAKIGELIAKDKALQPEAESIAAVDKLVRFHRDLYRLVNNFASFRDFYARKKAAFQAGTLYLDGRSFDLCIKVADAAAHAVIAQLSGACLAYCELARKGAGEKMTIVAAVTNGDSDHLMVGRNGIFYDRKGADWDATIVKIVENPISARQAFWTPYHRAGRLIEEQFEKFASARDKEIGEKNAAVAADGGKAAEVPAAPAPGPVPSPAATPPGAPGAPAAVGAFDVAKFAGIFAAIGLALGMLGSAVAAIVGGFLKLEAWQMLLAVAGVLLVISGPSMLLAYLKLRKRNIGPILDGAGWAVNARAKLNVPFGASLTQLAVLPHGAHREMKDPFEERRRPWLLYVVLLILLAAGIYFWRTGQLHAWLHHQI